MTTNTHIAAQARDLASKAARLGARLFGEEIIQCLRECAKALEAAPALDAQGEAPSWYVNFIERGWVNPVVEVLINNKTIGRFHDFGPVREVLPKVLDAALRAWTAPPPPAVGKPLSEDACNDVMDEARRLHRKFTSGVRGQMLTINDSADYWLIRATEAAHGIVNKETGNG